MNSTFSLGLASILGGLACSSPSLPPQTRPGVQPSGASATREPRSFPAAQPQMQVKWIVRGTGPGRVSLTAHIEVSSPILAPLDVKILVPDGASMDGQSEFQIAAPRAATTIDRDFAISFVATPSKDLLLTVDVRAASFGLHAEDTYRFGRAPPTRVLPEATGPRLKVGNVDLGASVPLRVSPESKPPETGTPEVTR